MLEPSSLPSPYAALPSTAGTKINDEKRRWAIALFSATTILLFADQNLMAPNLTAIAEEFDFSDEERDTKLGGHIALAFWLLGAPAALVIGVLADQFNRSKLFVLTVGIGEGACFMTFWSRTYWGLFICRTLTGFSIGGALPLIYSILGDMFRADERHKVNSYVGMGTGLGIAVGQGIAGFLGPTFGWRLPFLVVSIPALMCATAVLVTVDEPERGGMEQAVLERKSAKTSDETANGNNASTYSTSEQHSREMEMQKLKTIEDTETSAPTTPQSDSFGVFPRRRSKDCHSDCENNSSDYTGKDNITPYEAVKSKTTTNLLWCHMEASIQAGRILFKTPTVVLTMLQGVPGCLPWGIVNTYLNDFLAEDRGMSVEFATFAILLFGVGNFTGLVLAGVGGEYLYRVDKRYPALLAGSSAVFSCVPFWILLNSVNNNSSFLWIASISLTGGAASGIAGPIIKATLQNVTMPTMRGQAFALYNTADDFGKGLGPVFVAHLITSMGGRTPAFNFGTLAWALCGVLNLAMFFTAEQDEQRVQEMLSAHLKSDVLC